MLSLAMILMRLITAAVDLAGSASTSCRTPSMRYLIATSLLQECAGYAEPVIESHAGGLTTKQKTEMARQFVLMLPSSLRSGVAVRIDSCFFSLYMGHNPYGGSCTYYVS